MPQHEKISQAKTQTAPNPPPAADIGRRKTAESKKGKGMRRNKKDFVEIFFPGIKWGYPFREKIVLKRINLAT